MFDRGTPPRTSTPTRPKGLFAASTKDKDPIRKTIKQTERIVKKIDENQQAGRFPQTRSVDPNLSYAPPLSLLGAGGGGGGGGGGGRPPDKTGYLGSSDSSIRTLATAQPEEDLFLGNGTIWKGLGVSALALGGAYSLYKLFNRDDCKRRGNNKVGYYQRPTPYLF